MKRKLMMLPLMCALAVGCSEQTKKQTEETTEKMENPFFNAFETPFEVPPFHLIKDEHYLPALRKGIAEQAAEIDAITSSEEEPTFENTILALENSGKLLSKVSSVFYNLNSANTSEELQSIAQEISPELSAHRDDISLNETLFERIKTVWENKETFNLNPQELKLLENNYNSFIRGGANLNNDEKIRLREINEKLSSLSLTFGQNVLAETNNFQLVIENEEDLSGLPQGIRDAAKEDAKQAGHEDKWLFTLQNPSVLPFLQYADNRDLRKKIWEVFQTKGFQDNDYNNEDYALQMANLRREKAQLLGYDNHAAFKLEKSMAGNPESVFELLNQLWEPALNKAKEEAKQLQKMIEAEGHDFDLAPYDWRYYTEKVRQEQFELDEEELRAYFSLENVKHGIFDLCDRLFGLQFEQIMDIPVYHEDVVAYEVKEKTGEHVGVLYMDFHPRASKRGGAWMTSYRSQSVRDGERFAPVISIVCNFSKPTENKPSLLTFDEVETFFHEFGHALHGLLSDVQFKSLAGTSVYTDFVELPSQIMENWAGEPAFMKTYAKHYETGETIPDELIEKLETSGTFNQGFATTEYLAASLLDMAFHTITEDIEGNVTDFETNAMNEIGLIDEIIPRYRSTYFNHIFAGGYSAGYYSYIWSGVLDTDAYEAFKETALFDTEIANAFRTNILETGGTKDPMELYINFRGKEPSIKPLLRKRGLN